MAQCGMLVSSCIGPSPQSPFWMSCEQAVEVAIGVGMQEQAELILAMLFAHGFAANVGIVDVAVTVLVVKVLQNSAAKLVLVCGSVGAECA